MEIEGMIIRDLGLFEGVSKAGNPWKKHEWVLETVSQYPRKIKFTVFGDKVNTINFELGKRYVIQVDVESREFNERWYTDLTAYNYRPLEDNTNIEQSATGPNIYTGNPGGNRIPDNPYKQDSTQSVISNPTSSAATFGGSSDFSQVDEQEDLPF